MSRLTLFVGAGVLLWVNCLYAQEAIHDVQWSPEHFAFPQLSERTLIQVPAVESLGSFPYYLYIKLPYPLGIADLKSLPGAGFDAQAYGQVSQHLYMGYLDRNDTLPFDEA